MLLVVVVEGVTSAAATSGGDSGGGGGEDGDGDGDDEGSGGIVVSDIRYWNPWHPPDSTWIRSARSGFLSWAMILERRCGKVGVLGR